MHALELEPLPPPQYELGDLSSGYADENLPLNLRLTQWVMESDQCQNPQFKTGMQKVKSGIQNVKA